MRRKDSDNNNERRTMTATVRECGRKYGDLGQQRTTNDDGDCFRKVGGKKERETVRERESDCLGRRPSTMATTLCGYCAGAVTVRGRLW